MAASPSHTQWSDSDPTTINSVEKVRSFLGLCSYYRRFISGFSKMAKVSCVRIAWRVRPGQIIEKTERTCISRSMSVPTCLE